MPRPTQLLTATATFLGVATLGLWLVQDTLIFPGAFQRTHDPAALVAMAQVGSLERIQLAAPDGTPVVAWVRRGGHDRVLVSFHGNGDVAPMYGALADRLAGLGWDVVMPEYRGYGDSPGWPSEEAMVSDARVVWDWVVGPGGWSADRAVLQGDSLGGGVAIALATEVDAAGLVVSSTFDRLSDVAAGRFWFLPVRWLISTEFPSVARAAEVAEPVLQLHSRDDTTIPFGHAERLNAAFPNAQFVPLDGYGHSAAYLFVDPVARPAWESFLENAVPR